MNRIVLCVIAVFFLSSCAADPRAASSQRAAARLLIPPPTEQADPFANWTDPNDLKGKTLNQIREMNPQCVYMLKPEARIECLMLLFESHQRVAGKPYLTTIVENWLSNDHPVGIEDRGNMIQIVTCEDQWQWGDLNADGRIDLEDFAMYGNIEPR